MGTGLRLSKGHRNRGESLLRDEPGGYLLIDEVVSGVEVA
jgi:hypothetical protein